MVRVLLVLTASAVLLYGCGQSNTPVQKQEKKHGLDQAAPKPVTKVQGVTEPAASKPAPAPEPTTPSTNAAGGMSGEQAALAEAYCRMVTYASKKDMSQQEVSAFVERTTQRSVKKMEGHPSLSAGAAGNQVLDDQEVPRYTQCEVGGE
jgi:hypothetical protein